LFFYPFFYAVALVPYAHSPHPHIELLPPTASCII
jgi:hypothetical protein